MTQIKLENEIKKPINNVSGQNKIRSTKSVIYFKTNRYKVTKIL